MGVSHVFRESEGRGHVKFSPDPHVPSIWPSPNSKAGSAPDYCHLLKLNTKEDLEELRALAQDRKGWKKLTRAIILKSGEAATPNGEEAEPQ